jgi:hypothetical protein
MRRAGFSPPHIRAHLIECTPENGEDHGCYEMKRKENRKGYAMLEAKDFVTGCLTIIVGAVLIPLRFLVFKLTLFIAIPLGIIISVILGITILGRMVRLFISKKL